MRFSLRFVTVACFAYDFIQAWPSQSGVVRPKIVGGETVDSIDRYPWMATIKLSGKHMCGGSMIAPNMILTAAHCILLGIRDVAVSCRKYNVTASEDSIDFEVLKIVQHPNYTIGPDEELFNDVAILVLKQTSNPGNHTVPVAALSKDVTEPHGTEPVRAIGWGLTSFDVNGYFPDILMQVDVPIVDNKKCAELYSNFGGIADTHICAGLVNGGKDTCIGDSGGPLFREVNGKPVIYGITSWGTGCAAPGFPGVYERVASHASWIEETMKMYTDYDGTEKPSTTTPLSIATSTTAILSSTTTNLTTTTTSTPSYTEITTTTPASTTTNLAYGTVLSSTSYNEPTPAPTSTERPCSTLPDISYAKPTTEFEQEKQETMYNENSSKQGQDINMHNVNSSEQGEQEETTNNNTSSGQGVDHAALQNASVNSNTHEDESQAGNLGSSSSMVVASFKWLTIILLVLY